MNKRCFFPSVFAGRMAGLAIAAMLMTMGAAAQTASAPAGSSAAAQQPDAATVSNGKTSKKAEKVVESKDTKKELRKTKKTNSLVGVDAKLPDKALYDKSMDLLKRGHFDVARLDLQTLLNTYPDSEYQMRAKLAIADSWYREGGTAALTQAEAEYADFRVFFPNAPEAAEAQMRIGDIYFRQMDKPDRDYSEATHAEEEYRRMLTDYPDSTLVPQAKQRLREVQEALAMREAEIGEFYAGRANWAAAIARYQTVVDSYPEYSHLDDVLLGLGDAYGTQAKYIRTLKLPEAAKAELEKEYDGQAAAAYRKVVLEHAASARVEDARDRLDAMGMKVPEPTPEQIAASTALENSRKQYRLQDRLGLMFLHKPDVVQAATIGEPTLTNPKPTTAPQVLKQIQENFSNAMNPGAAKPAAAAENAATAPAAVAAPAGEAPAGPVAPLTLNEVPTSEDATGVGSTTSGMTAAPMATPAATGNSVGVEIVSPAANSSGNAPTTPNTTGNPAADNYGLKAVGATNTAPLPPVEKPAEAPSQVNAIAPGAAPPAQIPAANGKNAKPEYDKSDESSSTHKKKKGLKKLNPF